MTDVTYIAVDVEASGPTPANYSLLSIGASVVSQPEKQFYRELKPLNENFVKEAMCVGSLGLTCLDTLRKNDFRYEPKSGQFQPNLVMKVLEHEGQEPKQAMFDFGAWIESSSTGKRPILVSDCDAFDGMFIHYYFDKFGVENPFVFGGFNIGSFYKGLVMCMDSHINNSDFWSQNLTHNAAEDAYVQANAMKKMLEHID